MVSPSDRIRINERRLQRSHAAERVWTWTVLVLVSIVTLSALVFAVAPSRLFCTTCHSDKTGALDGTTHRGLSCDVCHTGATPLGLVESRLRTLDMIPRQFLPVTKQTVAKIDSRRCMMCHSDDISETKVSNGVRMSHAAPLQKGWDCTDCHAAVAHGHAGRSRIGYTMDTCMQCHSSLGSDVKGCETCHPKSSEKPSTPRPITPWRVTHGPNWSRTHGMGDLSTCKGCHAPNYCAQCHNVNVPHPSDYTMTHGGDVLSRPTRADCMVCHTQSSCDGCHGMPMPHAEDFLTTHKQAVSRYGRATCVRCHPKETCDKCHVRHTHPGLNAQWREWLKANPTD